MRKADVLDIVSLTEMKRELRIGADSHDDDAMIETQLAAAESWCSAHLGQPIVESTDSFDVAPPAAADDPLTLPVWEGAELVTVRYWTTSGALRLDADGELLPADLGRTSELLRRTAVWPPEHGWPAVLPGSAFAVTVLRGLDLEESKWRAVAQAIVLMARRLYTALDDTKPDAAVYAMLRPFRRLV